VYVGNSVDGSAIAAELAPIKAETANDTMLDDLLVMNFLPKTSDQIKKTLSPPCPNEQQRVRGVLWRYVS
jgi:hypothetical protein